MKSWIVKAKVSVSIEMEYEVSEEVFSETDEGDSLKYYLEDHKLPCDVMNKMLDNLGIDYEGCAWCSLMWKWYKIDCFIDWRVEEGLPKSE